MTLRSTLTSLVRKLSPSEAERLLSEAEEAIDVYAMAGGELESAVREYVNQTGGTALLEALGRYQEAVRAIESLRALQKRAYEIRRSAS